jgi:cysteinyl-tRNA synthetase
LPKLPSATSFIRKTLDDVDKGKLKMKFCATIALTIICALSSCGPLEFQGDFDNESPRAVTQEEIDYREEMVRFVEAIGAQARVTNPQFGVFPQNASELGAYPGYIATLTGTAQEDIYYGYIRDGQATSWRITQELEVNLDRFQAGGKLVLTLDYPFRSQDIPYFDHSTCEKIDWVYQRSSAKGYIPYATVRELNYLVVNPGHEPHPNEPPIINWEQVREWVIQLQPSWKQNRPDFFNTLGQSRFDLVVLDYSFDGSEAMEFTPEEISSLKNNLRGKVLAYLSIGEAEDYRWYWREEWDANHDGQPDPGAPEWLGEENPDWLGNYKVRYWYAGWQEIIFAYLDRILGQGFDGIYLDLVDAYEYYEG